MTFEKKLARIEEIVAAVEDGGTELEEALALYKAGIELAKECAALLKACEDEVLLLKKTSQGYVTEPFLQEEDE